MTDARITDRESDAIRAMGLTWPRDASSIGRASPDRPQRSSARRPLGLAPVLDDIDDGDTARSTKGEGYLGPEATAKELVDSSIARLSEEHLNAGVSWGDLLEYGLGTAFAAVFGEGDALRERIREQARDLRKEISDLKAALIEARHETRELKLIQESLRISTRGESGRDGSRGIQGRDGLQGPIGPRGERGEQGKPAPTIAAWSTDDAAFTATPIMADGSTGPALRLRGMFEVYDEAADASEAAEEADAARAQRAVVEREAEAVRQGRPARGP
jgi:hypothetical protein